MSFRTNPYLEKSEKEHPNLFFIISIIISLLVLLFGLWYLFEHKEDANEDKTLAFIIIVLGASGLISELLLKTFKKSRK